MNEIKINIEQLKKDMLARYVTREATSAVDIFWFEQFLNDASNSELIERAKTLEVIQ